MKHKLLIVIIFITLLTACGGKKNTATTNSNTPGEQPDMTINEDPVDFGYVDTGFTVSDYEDTIKAGYVISDNYLYFTTFNPNSTGNKIYRVSTEGGKAEKLELSLPEKEYQFANLCLAGNSDVCFTIYDFENNSTFLCRLKDGQNPESTDISYIFEQSGAISYIYLDNEDNICVCGSKSFTRYNGENIDFSIDYPRGYVLAYDALTPDRTPIMYTSSDNNITLYTIDFSDRTTKQLHTISDLSDWGDSGFLYSGFSDYDVIYYSDEYIFGLKSGNDEPVKLISLQSSGISQLFYPIFLDDNCFIALASGGNDLGFKKYKMPGEEELRAEKEKTVLTMLILAGTNQFSDIINEFNQTNENYRIVVIDDYDHYEDQSLRDEKITLDITAGKYPDIYFSPGYGVGTLSFGQSVSKGLYEDLTPYFENDSEAGIDSIVPSVYEALKFTDGKIYHTSNYFSINTLWGKNELLGDKETWNMKDVISLAEKNEDSLLFFGIDNIPDSTLRQFNPYILDNFVNWPEKSCSFDSEDFTDILKLCMTQKANAFDPDEINSETPLLLEDKLIFPYDDMFSPKVLKYAETVLDGKVNYIGYPASDGRGCYISLAEGFAISSKSQNKDAAWEFIKMTMTEDYQCRTYTDYLNSTDEMPVNIHAFDLFMQAMTATDNYYDEFGNLILKTEFDNIIIPINGFFDTVELSPLTEEEAEKFRMLVSTARPSGYPDSTIISIVHEEAASFFNGDKSAEEVAAIINDRVYKYINEQS